MSNVNPDFFKPTLVDEAHSKAVPNHRADHMDGDFQISFILFWYCCMVSNHVLKHFFGYTMIYCISWDNIMNNAQKRQNPKT
jgi:hypothetical protein